MHFDVGILTILSARSLGAKMLGIIHLGPRAAEELVQVLFQNRHDNDLLGVGATCAGNALLPVLAHEVEQLLGILLEEAVMRLGVALESEVRPTDFHLIRLSLNIVTLKPTIRVGSGPSSQT